MTKNCDPFVFGPAFACKSHSETRFFVLEKTAHHRQEEGLRVFDREALVFELLAVDGFATSTIEVGEVTSLNHESLEIDMMSKSHGTLALIHVPFDDTMKLAPFVCQFLAHLAHPLLAGT